MDRHRLIAAIVACAAALVLSGCPAPGPSNRESASFPESAPSPASLEADRREVVEAHRALVRAYESGDVEAFVRALEPSAELLVFHARLEDRFDGVDDVRRQLPRMFARLGDSRWSDHHAIVSVYGDVAWLTSQVLVESANVADPFVGRGTEIYVRRPDGWKLIHGHWSTVPES